MTFNGIFLLHKGVHPFFQVKVTLPLNHVKVNESGTPLQERERAKISYGKPFS